MAEEEKKEKGVSAGWVILIIIIVAVIGYFIGSGGDFFGVSLGGDAAEEGSVLTGAVVGVDEEGDTHLGCAGETCVVVPGEGSDECDTSADCESEETHLGCVGETCAVVSGAGLDECDSNADCGGKDTHAECQDNACVVVEEPGVNQCGTDSDCLEAAGPTHLGCVNDACVVIEGEGDDECSFEGEFCGIPKPDLVIDELSAEIGGNVGEGDTHYQVTLKVVVSNIGEVEAASSSVRLALAPFGQIVTLFAAGLNSDESTEVSTELVLPKGFYTLSANANFFGIIEEMDKKNNLKSLKFFVPEKPAEEEDETEEESETEEIIIVN